MFELHRRIREFAARIQWEMKGRPIPLPNALKQAILLEHARTHGIRVFAVAPGAVETRMLRDCFPDFPSADTLAPDDVAWLGRPQQS